MFFAADDGIVVVLEARVDAHAAGLNDLRQAVVHLEQRMDRRFESMDGRFTAIDGRFSALDGTLSARFDTIDTKINHLTSIVVWALAAILAAVGSLAAVLLR